jgi:NAD(P)H-dependent flavin oxidoreductase YrpB (nitropropane dioxygenase family)
VGQVVGQIREVETSRAVVQRLMQEYVDALERMNTLMERS